MRNGWHEPLPGIWYYYVNGKMQTGWKKIDGIWYYFQSNGIMQTGWKEIDNDWYYFRETSPGKGAMLRNEWLKWNNNWYYLKSGGDMAKNEWVDINCYWYYFQKKGEMFKAGTLKIENVNYIFDQTGRWIVTPVSPPTNAASVDIMQAYSSPLTFTNSTYRIANIPDKQLANKLDTEYFHAGSGFNKNGNFSELKGDLIATAILRFVKKVYGTSFNPPKENYCYFLFGENNNGSYHQGVDMNIKDGAVIRANYGGTVTGVKKEMGLVAIYVPEINITTVYMHMSGIGVKVGDTINAQTPIGKQSNVTNNGRVGSHLHYEVRAGKKDTAANYRSANEAMGSIVPYAYMK